MPRLLDAAPCNPEQAAYDGLLAADQTQLDLHSSASHWLFIRLISTQFKHSF